MLHPFVKDFKLARKGGTLCCPTLRRAERSGSGCSGEACAPPPVSTAKRDAALYFGGGDVGACRGRRGAGAGSGSARRS